MWYVIQTKACHELEMVNKVQEILKPGEEVFTIQTEREERIKGEWTTKRYVTFQKYLFVDTDEPDDLRMRLRDVKGLTKMLCVDDTVTPIYPEEEEFLKKIGGEDHVIGKSLIYTEGDKVTVTDGPLANLEGTIKWTNKRQRLIGITVKMFGEETIVKLSADYIKKD